MRPAQDAGYAVQIVKECLASLEKQYKNVCVKIANYTTEEDFQAFKPGQQLESYDEAVEALSHMCRENGWLFDGSTVLRKETFDDFAKQNGLSGLMSEKIDFAMTALGHERHDGVEANAYGVSPIVVLASSEPTFPAGSTVHSGHAISS
jgi:hypothetical protein